MDKTHVKVKGRWCYLYRAMEKADNPVVVRLSEKRDIAAAKAFFEQAKHTKVQVLVRVVGDSHTSYPRTIAEVLGAAVKYDRVCHVTNPIEQDHRGIKQRCYPMLGFKNVDAAARFCQILEEVRQCFRPRR